MRMSTLFLRTLREDPADAELPSHRLLVRAGYIRRVAPGIYTWLPLGLRVLRNVERIVREEMNAIGAQELSFPALLPKEPFEATGRWVDYGENIFRLKDRKGADYLLGPTHEEMFTLTVKDLYGSYKDLPLSIYQIQLKYRDEVRPRAGLLRCREFIMKDSYSFDVDDAGLQASYDTHRGAYVKIFDRLGFDYVIVKATSGAMGGSASEEFLATAEHGEDTYVRCGSCDYAANVEAVQVPVPQAISYDGSPAAHAEDTPDTPTIATLVDHLNATFPRADRAWQAGDTLKNVLVMLVHPDGRRAAHRTGGRLDDDVVETQAIEDLDIGAAVRVIRGLQAGVVDVEGVGVLHDELATAQQAGARTYLVAILELDLVDRQGQILVGAVEVLDRQREHLFVRGAEQVVSALAVLEPEDVLAVVGPAAGRLEGLLGQQRREAQLLGADGVHLVANDALDVAQHLQTERQPGVDAGSDAADVAGADQQPVAGQLRIGRVTSGPGTNAPDIVRISAGDRRTHANCLDGTLLPHRSHQDRGEAPDVGEPGPGVGGTRRRVEVIDVKRDHRGDLGPDLLDDRGHGGRRQSLATPARRHPDTLNLSNAQGHRTDVGLEHDLTVVDPYERVPLPYQGCDALPIELPRAPVRRVADLFGEHGRGSRHHEVHLVKPGQTDLRVPRRARWKCACRGQHRLVSAHGARLPPGGSQSLPQRQHHVRGSEHRGTLTPPSAHRDGKGRERGSVAPHGDQVGRHPADRLQTGTLGVAQHRTRGRGEAALKDARSNKDIRAGIARASL